MTISFSRPSALLTLMLLTISVSVHAGSWQQNISMGGFDSVNIYTPDADSPIGAGKSLMLVLHGCVQPIDNYLTANLEVAAEKFGMVIAVPDAANKAGFNCWSYWQGDVDRASGDYQNLIQLADALGANEALGIDKKQVYIAGLSSGAVFAAQVACVAPDVFAGVATSAGPTIGTSVSGAIKVCETVSSDVFKSRCEGYSGSEYDSFFSTQIAIVGHGTVDTTVNACYNQQNADGYANLYGIMQLPGTSEVRDELENTAQVTSWENGRVSMLWFDGLGHSWSGGAGASGDYISDSSINFASYLANYFIQNNLRVEGD